MIITNYAMYVIINLFRDDSEGRKCMMPLTRKAKMAFRMTTIVATTLITATVSVIGAVIAMQGGDFWPWVWVMCILYGIELVFTGVAAVMHYRSSGERKKREFYERRRERQALRNTL